MKRRCVAAAGLAFELTRVTGTAGAGSHVSPSARQILGSGWDLEDQNQKAGRSQEPSPGLPASRPPARMVRQLWATARSPRTARSRVSAEAWQSRLCPNCTEQCPDGRQPSSRSRTRSSGRIRQSRVAVCMGRPGPEPGGMDPDTAARLPRRWCRLVIKNAVPPGSGLQRPDELGA